MTIDALFGAFAWAILLYVGGCCLYELFSGRWLRSVFLFVATAIWTPVSLFVGMLDMDRAVWPTLVYVIVGCILVWTTFRSVGKPDIGSAQRKKSSPD